MRRSRRFRVRRACANAREPDRVAVAAPAVPVELREQARPVPAAGDVERGAAAALGRQRPVVLLKPGGTLEVMGANGAPVRTFANSAVTGAELMGGRLLMLVLGHIREYKIQTGALVRTRPLPNVTNAGVCGMPPCPAGALGWVDAKRGLVAYIQSGKLHLLRLRDGRNRIVHGAADARFGDDGLFYAFSGAAPWVSRIRFVPWRALPLRP